MIKTSGIGREQQPLVQLPRFTDKPALCVVAALQAYMSVTEDIKENIDVLF